MKRNRTFVIAGALLAATALALGGATPAVHAESIPSSIAMERDATGNLVTMPYAWMVQGTNMTLFYVAPTASQAYETDAGRVCFGIALPSSRGGTLAAQALD